MAQGAANFFAASWAAKQKSMKENKRT